MGKVFYWIDGRFKVKEPHKFFFKRPIPPGLYYSYCLGGAALTLFLLSAVTGLLLSSSYIPSEEQAYNSIIRIHDDVHLGWLVRSMHKWSANLLITL
jgi:quinol-cytochrome oxidoreductase complex cytochrome b subunit